MFEPEAELEDDVVQFTTRLRLARGYDEASFHRLCEGVRKYFAVHTNSTCLPRHGVLILVGIYQSIYSSIDLYDGKELQNIIGAAAIANDLIADLLVNEA